MAPKLIVDNAPSSDEDDDSDFPYSEFLPIAQRILEIRRRFPEIDLLHKRAFAERDMALTMALFEFEDMYWHCKDYEANEQRKKLKVMRRKTKGRP